MHEIPNLSVPLNLKTVIGQNSVRSKIVRRVENFCAMHVNNCAADRHIVYTCYESSLQLTLSLNSVQDEIKRNVVDCERNLCKNGWCEETMVDYKCHCSVGFQGKHCDEESTKSTDTEAMTVPKTSPTTVMSVQLETTTSEETTKSKSTESLTTEATTAPKTSPTDTISEQSETTTSEETTTSACTSPMEIQSSGSYYNFSTCEVDHGIAVSACSQYGSHLVFIKSSREQVFIMDQIKDSSEDYWIGLTRNSDMEVTWLDGSRLTYDNTARVSPFNDGGECIRIDGRSSDRLWHGAWHDKPCSTELRYICEKEIDPN